MKRLILVRHGDYGISALTDFGRKQMQQLAPALANSVVGNMLLVSSPLQRAEESATILAEYFHVPVDIQRVWEDDDAGAFQFIVGIDASIDTLLVVTHLPLLESLPKYFGREVLGVSFPYSGVGKGQAQVIDCEMKTMTHVTPAASENQSSPVLTTPLVESRDQFSPVRPTPTISRTNGSYTKEHAERYAARLKQVAAKNRLKKTYLFGSIAKHGSGNDVDLVLEVSRKVFLEFASACVGALDGFHPVTVQLLPWASAYWGYESPKEARAKYALDVLSVLPDASDDLSEIVPYKKVDILCLPIGWRDKTDVNQVLHKAFGFGRDPDLLKHIIDSAIELR